ncbi:MAG: hypothetical protein GXY54_10315 [Deltaproteobacteria bacterium]|nr:hypothetical protein [Deltaproteobacteria bacterium]
MKGVSLFVALLFVVVCSAMVFAAPAPQKVVDLANTKLAELGKDKIVVKSVRAVNAEGRTMEEIKKIDEEWIAAKKAGTTIPLMTELMGNNCAKQLKEMMAAHPFITEIFVTGNMGGNVCQTALTGDFWQGDEAKFKDVFKKGILVGEVEQEDGKNISLVSVPVKMGELHVGTMHIGVDVDKVP